MSLEQRLARCIAYRDEAMKQPEDNKLYIEDLNLSIALFEQCKTYPSIIQKGWADEK